MRCKTTALIALLVSCVPPVVLADTGNRAGHDGVFVKRPMSTMSNGPTGAVNDAARTFTADKRGAFVASPLVPRARLSRGGSVVRTKPWVKFTGPRGEPVYINVEQMTSVRSDTEISGANTQLELVSGKFQRVQEDVEQVMQLISATSDARETDEISSAP